ncbi:MAG: hypothetical protein ACKPEY_01635 [Planctomycetota bacterium]
MTDRPIAGFECKLYYNSANVGSTPTWVEIKNAKDVSHPDSVEAIEASARYSKSKRYIAGMFDGSIEFGYQYIRGTDAVFTAPQNHYLNHEPIAVAAADNDIAVAGTTYGRDWYVVTKFERSEELGGTRTYNVTLQPTVVFNSGTLIERTFVVVGS